MIGGQRMVNDQWIADFEYCSLISYHVSVMKSTHRFNKFYSYD